MLLNKFHGRNNLHGYAWAYLIIPCALLGFGEMTEGSDFTLSFPACYNKNINQTMKCKVNGDAIKAENCRTTEIILQIVETQVKIASSEYPSCNTNWSAFNGRCVSNDPAANTYEYEFRLTTAFIDLNGKIVRCWSDCTPLINPDDNVSLTSDYGCCDPIKFDPTSPCLHHEGIGLLCFGVILIVADCIIGITFWIVTFKGGPLSKLWIVGTTGVCGGCVLLISAGSLLITEKCDESECVFSNVQIIGIVLACIGGTAVISGIVLIIVVCVKKFK